VGVDLRHTPSVEALCHRLLQTLPQLDFIVHNACQTVRRPAGYYRHLWKRERMAIELLPAAEQAALQACAGVADPVLLSQVELLPEEGRNDELFPAESYDCDQQQVDLRAVNSWKLELADVSSTEVIETHLCNAVAPFVINGMLKPLLTRNNAGRDRHIVNVSAMEGQFYRAFKTSCRTFYCFFDFTFNLSQQIRTPTWPRPR
jgi:NAD(P)-dependent dehydrogenase (short-subunit alcohol dehydrogenase family)